MKTHDVLKKPVLVYLKLRYLNEVNSAEKLIFIVKQLTKDGILL